MNRRSIFSALILALLMPAVVRAELKPLKPVEDGHKAKIDEVIPQLKAAVAPKKPRKVLAWIRPAGFVHSSILTGAHAVEAMGKKTGAYETVVSNDLAMFLPENLKQFDAVILVNTTGAWIKPADEDMARLGHLGDKKKIEEHLQKSFVEFVDRGGGVAGFHSASDANYHWKEFGEMIGGYFHGHPWHEAVGIKVENPAHPLCAAFKGQAAFRITDEIYQFKEPYSRKNLHVLLSLDVTQTNMKKDGIHRTDSDFAVAWVRNWGKGRIFYSSLGHREEIFWNPMVLQFYLDGFQFVLGDLPAPAAPGGQAAAGSDSEQGWQSLFDGKDLSAWNFKPDGWKIEDGVIALVKGGGYLWSKETHGDFELTFDFKVSEGCNSGLFFRTDPKDPVQKGFEIQIFDSYGKEPGKHAAGALYDAQAPGKMAMKPAGQWNTGKLVCRGPVIQYELNGESVLNVNIDDWKDANQNPDGSKNKFRTPLKDLPRTGQIGFQDHGHPVWFRSVRIRPL